MTYKMIICLQTGSPYHRIFQMSRISPCSLQVVKETLRMSNVLLWFPRVALHDCTIEGKPNSFKDNKTMSSLSLASTTRGFLTSVFLAFMIMLLTRLLATTGFEIKKGWHVNIDATCVHYDSDLYKDPLKFNPQRFDVASSLSPSYFAFFLLFIVFCFFLVSENYFT